MGKKKLGLGLIGIGRVWGHVPGEVPAEKEALRFLEAAYGMGIRYFDTAPSYGSSEERLGRFLATLGREERAGVTVATKFGEHWDAGRGEPFVDHGYEALQRSLEQSVRRLGRIDVLQLHKTSVEALRSEELARAWEQAAGLGIGQTGASVSDVESAKEVCGAGRYQMMQLPLNAANGTFLPVLEDAEWAGLWVAVNRPFAMGRLLADAEPDAARAARVEAFGYLLGQRFDGVILSGTKSAQHLKANLAAFEEAVGAQTT